MHHCDRELTECHHLNAVKSVQIKFNFMQSSGAYLEIDRKITLLSIYKNQFNFTQTHQQKFKTLKSFGLQSIRSILRMNITEKRKNAAHKRLRGRR